MLKIAGIFLIMTGCAGTGVCLCTELRERIGMLYEMKRMLMLIGSQVDYSCETVPEICKIVSLQVQQPFSDFLWSVWEETEKNTGQPFGRMWENSCIQMEKKSKMKRKESAQLREFGHNFGYADRELQRRTIENQIKILEDSIGAIEKGRREQERIIMSVSIMGGLLLAVILL